MSSNLQEIKVIAFDIDGTLTDGSIYIGSQGEALKVFNVRDGYGIKAAEKAGYKIYFITGRPAHSPTIERLHDLKIDLKFLRENIKDKVACAQEIMESYSLNLKNMAFMGDDLPDIELLKQVGFSGAPKDAIDEICNIVHFVSQHKGGKGAAREFIDKILSNNIGAELNENHK
jgi:3-deoxy-D-manno-octulosonate 8-phosphate phosphatase (KDO 8-P phosphatase)